LKEGKMARLVIPRLCTICLVTLLVSSAIVAAYADAPPDEVKRAAEKGLPDFLGAIPKEYLDEYGFRNVDELEKATLGEPYRVYTVIPQSLEAYDKKTKLSSLLYDIDLWYFPVVVEGEARTILQVGLSEQQWKAKDLGGTSLAQALQSLEAQLPNLLKNEDVSNGYTAKLVRIYPQHQVFVAVASDEEEFVIPLLDVEQWGMRPNKLYAAEEVMPKIAETVQQAVQSSDEISGGRWMTRALEKEQIDRVVVYTLVFLGVVLAALAGLLRVRKAL
jgi:hypothetical protein